MERSRNEIDELISGKTEITKKIARQLESIIGGKDTFWLKREEQYRESLARLSGEASQSQKTEWLQQIPLREMINFGWIPQVRSIDEKFAACLKFFNVSDVPSWRKSYEGMIEFAAFRTSASFSSSLGAVAAWLRQGEIEALSTQCNPWNKARFKASLPRLRELTMDKSPQSFLPKLKAICAESGVCVVIAPAPSECRASGVTMFVADDKALVLLSFRYLVDDQFWFTFFHEAGHLILHGKKEVFVEEADRKGEISTEEKEANSFAETTLIPPEFRDELLNIRPTKPMEVARFARRIGISHGIVIGQLQHFGRIAKGKFNRYKVYYNKEEALAFSR